MQKYVKHLVTMDFIYFLRNICKEKQFCFYPETVRRKRGKSVYEELGLLRTSTYPEQTKLLNSAFCVLETLGWNNPSKERKPLAPRATSRENLRTRLAPSAVFRLIFNFKIIMRI